MRLHRTRGAAPERMRGYPNPPYTVLDKTPLSREKPYLYVDDKGKYMVRVPSAATNTSGISWADGMTPGRSIPISDFFIARPGDSVQVINNQLARGKNLILTPGVYDVARSISVKRADTVVLGMGLATLKAVNGATPMTIADKPGIILAGVTIDAGECRVAGAPAGRQAQREQRGRQQQAEQPDDPVRRVLPRRRPVRRQG